MSSSLFTFFSLPARAEFFLEAETCLLPLARADFSLFMVTPFYVIALNVELDFKIDLIVFDLDTGSAPASFSSRGRGVLHTEDSSAESYLVTEESVTVTKGSFTFICDSGGRIVPVS
nr:hypothetical protein [Tanacetum cinerariifolium]